MSEFKRHLEKLNSSYSNINRFRAFFIFEKYKKELNLKPIIHIIGTNGKGSTGRYLAQLLECLDYKIGHFTSPHIFSFNERFYTDKKEVSTTLLERGHLELKEVLKDDLNKLSYFEYATFLCPFVFKDCDFIILEAGLGGEYDATSIFEKRLSIFTKIGFDHTQILGNTLLEIARTKLKVMSKLALISNEQSEEVLNLAKKIAFLKNTTLINDLNLDKNLLIKFNEYSKCYDLAHFLQHNLKLALKACEILTSKESTFNALSKLPPLNLRGRLEKINENLFVDVGHNEMAARAIYKKFKGKKLILVYNCFFDKNIYEILKTLKPIIDTMQLYVYPSKDRKLASDEVISIAKKLNIKCEKFTHISHKKTLVFGSFMLVENFLKEMSGKK
ncbi:bifunctional folylpolyglutamate synthase/dihydrofolate synthase [Campylobacter sp. LR291e]|uniref:Mur ligase family protein n=1 Tax=unclassified Campylobacter TaxID=2593542 RepID=UPI001237F70D|nr:MULTISPECIES: Mur ligase family protein [unclassified Campylobacter]KAA6225623.1 bifunctional folylpolyglutamate synthase/dihydrofolate synthase [Campylobacter sp. LR185c]KAA6227525.1 bifunctional folylpolyglutamate synthase/dihydrofolate synthase [Campylobacter sp. LR196d]KAA6230942.1 bifunctional folylpolyglutamate synthase/dihydrofolate synthase [Campylobacter sp. LR291e]KAA6233576.1 bifunctional folylpolyglutamate synthase/dihydrofolate synthase [Campylobacter sp. LR264d]KAA8603861.1 bi